MTLAWYTAAIPMMKRPPKLADLLTHDRPVRKSWRDIKAALLFAMPPPANQQDNPK